MIEYDCTLIIGIFLGASLNTKRRNEAGVVLAAMEKNFFERGVTFTKKRRSVMTCLLGIDHPVSPYELADQYTLDYGEKIPAMSVYRILDFLAEKNFVHKLSSTNKYVACSHITCGHEHHVLQFLICMQCDQVSETAIDRAIVDGLRMRVEKTGFRMLNHQLEIRGICKVCNSKMK